MPEQGATPVVVADLRIELSTDRGDSTAHLSGSADALVLDVDDPAALLREVRGHRFGGPDLTRFANVPLSVRSHGRQLARLRLTSRGAVRVVPTPAGIVTVARAVLSDSSRRARIATGGSLLALVLTASAISRRHHYQNARR